MVAKRDLYKVLQVDPDAHPTVITAAFRALARLRHPDLNGTDDGAPMVDLNEAYETLRDPALRAAYDRWRGVAVPVSPGASACRHDRLRAALPPRGARATRSGSTSVATSAGHFVSWRGRIRST
jgi:curved DNA-binding protein CbpA